MGAAAAEAESMEVDEASPTEEVAVCEHCRKPFDAADEPLVDVTFSKGACRGGGAAHSRGRRQPGGPLRRKLIGS